MKPNFPALVVVLMFLFLSACAHQPVVIAKSAKLEQLDICLTFHELISEDDRLLHLDAMKEFIDEYNQTDNSVHLTACHQQGSRLAINIESTKFINPDKQVLYVLISAVGLYYPLSGGGIGFAWFGLNTTNLSLTLSQDLNPEGKSIYRQFVSSPYFNELDAVKAKHMQKFQTFMYEILKEITANDTTKV